jgi:hypothetical protein
VSATLRGLRSISVTPSAASSAASCRLSGGCDRFSRAPEMARFGERDEVAKRLDVEHDAKKVSSRV